MKRKAQLVRAALAAFGLCLGLGLVSSAQDAAFRFELVWDKDKRTVFARNQEKVEFTVTYTTTILENAQLNVPPTHTFVAPPEQMVPIINVVPEPGQRWNYSYRYNFRMGDFQARHDDKMTYSLPYAQGQTFLLGQGYNGKATHQGEIAYALDFLMPEGTPVHAARDGTVVHVVEHFTTGGFKPEFKNKGNAIYIRHEDRTIARYVHLQPQGALVETGMRVRARQPIGLSGNTGYSSRPHLHFDVFQAVDGTRIRTLPVRFATAQGAQTLKEGQSYRAP